MTAFQVTGGERLAGDIEVTGAKNSVLPILAAALLVKGESILSNCPHLSDTMASLDILEHLGAKTSFTKDVITVLGGQVTGNSIPDKMMKSMRSSVIFAGALLSLTGQCSFICPGGCDLGKRPLDLHLYAFEKLGYICEVDKDRVSIKSGEIKGGIISFPKLSVGATENAILAALSAEGKTTLIGCAKEPEIVDLQNFLKTAGAKISGAGTSVIEIEGKHSLTGCKFSIMPDRICTETYMLATASTGGDVFIKNTDINHSKAICDILKKAGCDIIGERNGMRIKANKRINAFGNVKSAPYPAFATDSGPCLVSAAATAAGTTLFTEGIFDSRFKYVKELVKMGADIKIFDKACLISGKDKLMGANMYAYDLRGGAALVNAALCAEGVSVIHNIHYIKRGYEDICSLCKLGARIEEIEDLGNVEKAEN